MKLISFDIETWGLKEGYSLQPWRAKTQEGGIICGYVYAPDTEECSISVVEDFNLEKSHLICGWNLKFDVAWLIASRRTGLLENRYLDGMLLLKRIMQDLPTYALKPTLEMFKDKINFQEGYEFVSGYSKDIEFKIGHPSDAYTLEELNLMHEYCKRDTVYTYCLVKYLMSIASRDDIRQCIRESTISVLFADIWQRGIPLDGIEVEKQAAALEDQLSQLSDVLSKVGLTDIVLNSPKQLRELLCSKWDIELTKLTPTGEFSVDQSVLKNLAFESTGNLKKIFRLVVKRNSLQTEYDNFICGASECLLNDDVAHPDVNICKTETGRMTYNKNQTIEVPKQLKNGKIRVSTQKIVTGVPIHQLKRGNLRKILKAPDGYKLVELDFAGQEMRLMADFAEEKTMIEFFNAGKDLHSYTAANLCGCSYEGFQELKRIDPEKYKTMRHLGKTTNFGLQYRAGANRLYREWFDKWELHDKTLDDAEKARNVYLDIYPGIPRYWQEIVHFARNQGFVQNKAGRKKYLPHWGGDNEWKSGQDAINFPVQSTGAEQTTLAIFYLKSFILKNGISLAWALHDGIFFFVPDCMMQSDLIQEMIEIVNNLPYEKVWGWEPKVRFPVEAKIGNNWGELESFC